MRAQTANSRFLGPDSTFVLPDEVAVTRSESSRHDDVWRCRLRNWAFFVS